MTAIFWQEAQRHWRGLIELAGWCAITYCTFYALLGLAMLIWGRKGDSHRG